MGNETVGANSSVDKSALTRVSDAELLARTEWLAGAERAAVCDLVLHVAEIDRRRAVMKRGYASTFHYCVKRLRYSEGAAYRLIRAARAVRRMPPIEIHLRVGSLSLEAVALLHAHLEEPDVSALLLQCANKTTRAIEALLARRRGAPVIRDSVRHVGVEQKATPPSSALGSREPLLLAAKTVEPSIAVSRPAVEAPVLQPAFQPPPPEAQPRSLIRVSFAVGETFLSRLRRAQDVLRHKYPDGCLEHVIGDALEALLDRKDMDRIVARRLKAAAARRARPPRG